MTCTIKMALLPEHVRAGVQAILDARAEWRRAKRARQELEALARLRRRPLSRTVRAAQVTETEALARYTALIQEAPADVRAAYRAPEDNDG